ncbi:MAG TPA: hypothetical protein VGD04_07270 [Methylophilus sp.]
MSGDKETIDWYELKRKSKPQTGAATRLPAVNSSPELTFNNFAERPPTQVNDQTTGKLTAELPSAFNTASASHNKDDQPVTESPS